MSKIELSQLSENEVEVIIPPDTPMEYVHQLTKGLVARGLIEDLAKSTLSVRYFCRPDDKANQLADKLIKSLQGLAKDEPYFTPKSQFANQARNRAMDLADRRAKLGVKQPTNVSPAPEPHVSAPTKPKMFDHTSSTMNTAGGTGKRYAYINDPVNKVEEHAADCSCGKCEAVEKSGSGYMNGGVKGGYSVADNIRRKANNVSDERVPGAGGPNAAIKQYSRNTVAGSQTSPEMKRKQPVKQFSPEEIAAENAKRGLKKWADHNAFPSAEEEIMKLAKIKTENGDEATSNQLAHLMANKSMLGSYKLPSQVQAMFQAPPPQPTDEQMFGHLVVTEEMQKANDQKWSGTFQSFFAEASKPISQRFNSPEEEQAYWDNIKIQDSDDKKPGY